MAALTVSAGGAIAVAAAAAVWIQGAPAPSGVRGGALEGPPQGTSAPWQAPGDACANSETRSAAEQALQSDIEGPHNAQLATPDEVPTESRERQSAAWRGLTSEDLSFQLCLRQLSADAPVQP